MTSRSLCKAVITGPTGAIGTALIRRMLQDDMQVYAVVRPDSSRLLAIPEHPNVHIVRLDVSELARLPESIPSGADAFYHFAWGSTVGTGRNDMSMQVCNIRYTIDAVRAAAALGCKVFIGSGSQAEYGRVDSVLTPETPCFPENGYGMAKLCAGQMSRVECRKFGIDHIWARILSVYGPGDGAGSMISSVIRQLLAGEKPALTAGEQVWDYLYSEDAAEALYLLGKRGVSGRIYVLGSGSSRPLKEYIKTLRDTVDPGLPLGFGQVAYSPQQVMHLQADITELQKDTDFHPQTAFVDGIRKTIEWVRNEYRERQEKDFRYNPLLQRGRKRPTDL